jgi:Ca-activated chloride channel family protein
LPALLRAVAIALLAFAIARPQTVTGTTQTSTEGIAIELVVDRSGSMNETMPTRTGKARKMDVVKEVVGRFVEGDTDLGFEGREGDLVGLVGFARYADTFCPLVRSHEPLIQIAKEIDTVQVRAEDGTAIGEAIALGAARLKNSEDAVNAEKGSADEDTSFTIKSKALVLITDGVNNAGDIDPVAAAQKAKEWGIKIYAIGIGGDESVTMNTPFGMRRMPFGSSFDDTALRRVAEITGGKYYLADSARSLVDIVRDIDALERSAIKSVEYTNAEERFMPFAMIALVALGIELILANLVFRSLP